MGRTKTNIRGIYRVDPSQKFPNGSWLVRYRDPEGRTKQRSFDYKRDAEDFLTKARRDRQTGDWLDPELARTPLSDLAERWYLNKEKQRTPATLAGYRSILDTHILPALGTLPVSRIRPSDIEDMLSEVKALKTQRNILRVLSPIMKLAVRDGMIRVNPCSLVELNGQQEHREMAFLTPEQVAQLVEEIGPEYRTLIYFAAYTGLRAGEIVALKVKHLDLVKRRVYVKQSATSVNGTIHVGAPKTKKSRRSVGLPAFLADMLMEHVAGRDGDDLVFPGSQGGMLRHGNFYNRHFRPAIKRLVERGDWPEELAGLRFHDLRHTTASLLIKLGTHPKLVSEWLGHSSIAITMDRYGKLYEGADKEALKKLDRLYQQASKGRGADVVPLRQP